MESLTAGTVGGLEAGLVVAGFALFTRPALVELEGEDDVVFILAELADEAFSLAQLEEKVRKKWLNAPQLPGKLDRR